MSEESVVKRLPVPTSGARGMMREIGTTGLRIFSGQLDEEFLPQLKWRRGIRVFEEMRSNDPTVGAVLFAVEMLMRQVEWRVEPFNESNVHVERAEFVQSCMNDMSETWEDTLASILSFLPFGFSLHEEVYKKRNGPSRDPAKTSRFNDGRIGWRKLPVRSQDTIERWDLDDHGEFRGAIQQALPHYIPTFLPCERTLLFRTSVYKGNPEGRSVLRNAYRPWFFKKRMEEIEGIGVERDLAGLPVAHVPPELLADDAPPENVALLDTLKKTVRNIRRDEKEGVIWPLAYDENNNVVYKLELLSTGGRRQFDTTAIVRRYDQRIAQTVLADFILLGQDRVGSFALASSKTQLFATAVSSWLDVIADVFNRMAIPRLFLLNGWDIEELPELMHGDLESIDLTELGDYITKLSGAGVPLFPDDELENVLRAAAKLPAKDLDSEAVAAETDPEAEPDDRVTDATDDGDRDPTDA